MTKEYSVEVAIKKTRQISFRKNDSRSDRQWDWYDGDDHESNDYFGSFEEAYEDAQKWMSS